MIIKNITEQTVPLVARIIPLKKNNIFSIKINKSIEIVIVPNLGVKNSHQANVGIILEEKKILKILSKRYKSVSITTINSERDLEKLIIRKPDLVFSGVKYFLFKNKKIWLNDCLDKYEIPYIASNVAALNNESDKNRAKKIMQIAKIKTADFFITNPGEYLTKNSIPIKFPLFVKPVKGGDSIGVDKNSIVLNFKSFVAKVLDIKTKQNSSSLVESYLSGKEYSVGIFEDNTDGNYELIVVVDGCTDKSEEVITEYLKNSEITNSVINTPDVFETKANNAGLKLAQGKYVTIIQDDMVIREKGWNTRMRKPFESFDDVFAVTARTAHNYKFNPNSTHLGMEEDLDNCWCDIVDPCDEANQSNIDRNTFAVRGTVNRGPLMINSEDLRKMNYFDEEFSPQDMDDHDLMFRMRKKLNKVVGCYWIDFVSDPSWGGTRKETGEPAPWLYKSQHKNSKIFYKRNKDNLERIIINRELPE